MNKTISLIAYLSKEVLTNPQLPRFADDSEMKNGEKMEKKNRMEVSLKITLGLFYRLYIILMKLIFCTIFRTIIARKYQQIFETSN